MATLRGIITNIAIAFGIGVALCVCIVAVPVILFFGSSEPAEDSGFEWGDDVF